MSSPLTLRAVLLPWAALPRVPAIVISVVPVQAPVASTAAIVPILASLAGHLDSCGGRSGGFDPDPCGCLGLGASLIVFNPLRLCQEVLVRRGLWGLFIDLCSD